MKKMRPLFLIASILCGSPLFGSVDVYALDENQFRLVAWEHQNFDFAAPVVASTSGSNIPLQAGLIVYDVNDGIFKGYSASGAWQAFGVSAGSPVGSGASTERVERVVFSAPSGGTCAVTSESGNWIDGSLSSSATATCTATFVTGIFSSAPTCTIAASGSTNRYCSFSSAPTTTGFTTTCHDDSGVLNMSNTSVQVICMGPQ